MGDDVLQREGFRWVLQFASGEATRADAEAFEQWRRRSPAHERAFVEAVKLRDVVRSTVQAGRAREQAAAVRVPQGRRVAVNRRALIGGAIAASAAGYMVVRPPLDLWPSLSEWIANYRTGVGEHRQVALAEGVVLDLNTRTSIADRSIGNEPRIELVNGEVAVTTARAPAERPLTIFAANGRAITNDATLNIRRVDGAVCVTCLAGKVQVVHPKGRAPLTARQQATYTADHIAAVAEADTTAVAAWRSGVLVFRHRPLSQVVDEINRYRPGKIILTNAALGQRTVYGVFHTDHIEGAVEEIRTLVGARATALPGGVVLLS
jgi:transmembrane sensor